MVKLTDKPLRRHRRKALKHWYPELYKKHRGLVEGVFGGTGTRYGTGQGSGKSAQERLAYC